MSEKPIAAKAIPKKRKRSATAGKRGQPPIFPDPKAFAVLVDQYFDSCWEEVWSKKIKPKYAGLKQSKLASLPADEVFTWEQEKDRHGNPVMMQVKPYTIAGLAQHLGTNRQTLLNYELKDDYFDTIKNAKVKCEAYTVEQLFVPKIAAGVIFNLKNNYGYTDKVDVTSDNKALPQPIINVHRDNSN